MQNSSSLFMDQNADNQSSEKHGDKVDFLPADIPQMFPQNDTIILGVWPGMPKLPKISLLFLCNILRKKSVMKTSIFCMQTSMKACYKLVL